MKEQGPTVAEERTDRQAQRDRLASWFRARPLEEVTPDQLRDLIGPHYQQRISECRRELGMEIKNLPQWRTDTDGRKHRMDGHYRYEPFVRLGRDAGDFVDQPWDASGPFVEPFRLKP